MTNHAHLQGSQPGGTVWLTGQTDLSTQLREGDYAPATRADHGLIPPAIAATVITRYTQPGDLVLDPDCGAGTVLVEALRTGRSALGLTPNRRWWRLARANLNTAKRAGAWCDGSVLDRPTTTLTHVRGAGIRGTVMLALTALRHPARSTALANLTATLTHTRTVLHPAGHIAVTIRPTRDPAGALIDLPTAVLTAAHNAGLIAVHHAIALTGALHRDRVHPRAGLDERRRAHTHPTGKPITLVAHRHILIFRAAEAADVVAAAARVPEPATRHVDHRAGVGGAMRDVLGASA